MGHGVWGMEHGVWSMGHGAWSMEHGAESMGHGAWGLEQGAGEFVWCPVWINLETPRLVFAFYGLEGL